MSLLDTAREYYAAGLNVLPADVKQKRPVKPWKAASVERPAFSDAFPEGIKFDALAIVCGATSGGLEVIDFDQKAAAWWSFQANVYPSGQEIAEAFRGLVVESTQNGGRHIAFRSPACGRNQKLARNADGVTIETRGEGGLVIVAPSPGYQLLGTPWPDVPTISEEVRAAFLECARACDKTPEKEPAAIISRGGTMFSPDVFPPTLTPTVRVIEDESVADYVRRSVDVRDYLARLGWSYIRDEGDFEHWQRPGQPVFGKTGGTVHKRDGFFHCFTSSAEYFEPDTTYTPLQLVAAVEFGGDISAASKEYGRRSRAGRRGPRLVECFNDDETADDFGAIAEEPERKPAPRAVEFPGELLEVGGLVGEFAEIANRYAIRPQPEGAFLASLSAVSFLCGRSLALNYNGTLVTPNIYALFLAPSGMGKDVLRRVCSAIQTAYDPVETSPESFASVQALQNLTARVRKVFWLHDEFGRDLAAMTGKQPNANISGVITESLKLYSNANNRAYLPKMIAQEAKGTKRPEPVDRPSLTIFATGNPREFYDATTEAVLRNGYVSRFSIVTGRTYSEKRRPTFEEATTAEPLRLPASLVSRVKAWRDLEQAADVQPFEVSFDREAFDTIAAFDEETERQIKLDVLQSDGAAEVRARLFEKVWKYALLMTASKFGPRAGLVVDEETAAQAVAFARYEAEQFAANAERFAASDVQEIALEILDWARALGRPFTRSEWVRKFQRKDKRKREEALDNLIEAEYIAGEESTSGKRTAGRYWPI